MRWMNWFRCRALQRGIPNIEVLALWDWHGKAAGPIRNAYMIDLAKSLGIEMVIAFLGWLPEPLTCAGVLMPLVSACNM